MLLCKKIKIEVSQQDAEALEFMQAKCRGPCNWWVMRLRSGERWRVNAAKMTLRDPFAVILLADRSGAGSLHEGATRALWCCFRVCFRMFPGQKEAFKRTS